MRRAAVLACAALLGCGGGEGKPLRQERPAEERRSGRADLRKTGYWEQLASRGIDELAARIAERGSDQRPAVRVRQPVNKTTFGIDTAGLARRIEASLEASGRFRVVAADSWDAADEVPELAPGEAAELRLATELESEITEVDGEVHTTATLLMWLVDRRGGLVKSTRQREMIVEPARAR